MFTALWATLALAGEPGADSRQQVADLEWRKGSTESLEVHAEDADPEVRTAVARALGRVGDAEAPDALLPLLGDEDPEVRLAAAHGLGFVPGSAPAIRRALDSMPPPPDGVLPIGDETRAALLRALGRQGDHTDAAALSVAVGARGPAGIAAMHGLADMGRRQVEGLGTTRPALINQLGALDPRRVEASTHALRRIGMQGAEGAEVSAVLAAAHDAPSAQARAWAVLAVWSELDVEARGELFAVAMTDEPLLRVAVLGLVDGAEVETRTIAGLLDGDGWTRRAAAEALVRLEAAEALQGHREDPDLGVAMAAARLLGLPDQGLLASLGFVRGAEATGEPEELEQGLTDPRPGVRTSAASALAASAPGNPELRAKLLDHGDPVVREIVVEALVAAGAAEHPALLERARVEGVPAVLLPILEALTDAQVAGARLDRGALAAVTDRAVRHVDRRVRVAGAVLQGTDPAAAALTGGTLGQGRDPSALVGDAAVARSAVVTTDRGDLVVELFPDVAPLAVANFVELAEADWFDGLSFHRVVPGFVVQTGCGRGDGWGGPGWEIPDEVSGLSYTAGTVGMARSGPDTGGSQWFITTTDQPHLEGRYTIFGRVTQGLEVARQLREGESVLDVRIERVGP